MAVAEVKYLRLDGTEVDVETIASPFVYKGKPASQVILWDITNRKHMEEALRESHAKWRSLVENIPDVIVTLDRDGTILFINRLFPGYGRAQVIGANISDFTTVPYRTKVEAAKAAVDAEEPEVAGAVQVDVGDDLDEGLVREEVEVGGTETGASLLLLL